MSVYIVVFHEHTEAGFQCSGKYLLLADHLILYIKILGERLYGYSLFSLFLMGYVTTLPV
jgi:hypothetical protein